MIKRDELTNPNSCMSRAKDDEMTFVLLGRDAAAPYAIREWAGERIRLGKNETTDPQIVEALASASAMEASRGLTASALSVASCPAGFLEVGHDEREVIVNHPDLKPDANGVGHITFSPAQARNLAALLVKHADQLDGTEKAPDHPFEVRIAIGGNDWDYIERQLPLIAAHVREHGPECRMMSGGGGGCHSVDVFKREISGEDYNRELLEWSDRQRGRR